MTEKEIVRIPCEEYPRYLSIYRDPSVEITSAVLYFHGGALIYGSREDLPEYHIERLCSAGCAVAAMDYPLAPAKNAAEIADAVAEGISWFIKARSDIFGKEIPYFLFGRSAGAYLCLQMLKRDFSPAPKGIISYYGYGLLSSSWYNEPSAFYLRYPSMPGGCISALGQGIKTQLAIQAGFASYVYLRQTGKWGSFLKGGSGDNPSLRDFAAEPVCPLFLAHSKQDTDVPFSEFEALRERFPRSTAYTVNIPAHDFDSDTSSESTAQLLDLTVKFIEDCI